MSDLGPPQEVFNPETKQFERNPQHAVSPPGDVAEGWYADRFGFHQHPEEWPLNITRRAHERCCRAWIEEA